MEAYADADCREGEPRAVQYAAKGCVADGQSGDASGSEGSLEEPAPEPSPHKTQARWMELDPAPVLHGRQSRRRPAPAGIFVIAAGAVAGLLACLITFWPTLPVPSQLVAYHDVNVRSLMVGEHEPPAAVGDRRDLVVIKLERMVVPLHMVDSKFHFFSAYYGAVQMGGQTFTVMFDTGSGNVILPSVECESNTCKQRSQYSRASSSTARELDFEGNYKDLEEHSPYRSDDQDMVRIVFGTGEVDGSIVEDTFCPVDSTALSGPVSTSSDCVRLPFIACTSMSATPFDSFTFDGVVGLAMAPISHSESFNFVQSMAKRFPQMEHARTFAVFLAQSNTEEESEIIFGGWDDSHIAADDSSDERIAWQNVRDPANGHWIVPLRAIRLETGPGTIVDLDMCMDGSCSAAVDTGTATLASPTSAFRPIYRALWHRPSLEEQCSGDYPKIHFDLEGFRITLRPEDFAALVHNSSLVARENQTEEILTSNLTYCKPLVMVINLEAPLGPNLFILGEPAMRRYYTIFDADKARVGFSLAQHANM